QRLSGYRRPEFEKVPLVRALEPSTLLHLAIALPARNSSDLDNFVREVSDPKSPSYRKFITRNENIRLYSPTPDDYEKLMQFAKHHGLSLTRTHDNRSMIDVTATVQNIQSAFHVKMNLYRRPDKTLFFAPDREPSLDLDIPILVIAGLENYVLPRHNQTPTQ